MELNALHTLCCPLFPRARGLVRTVHDIRARQMYVLVRASFAILSRSLLYDDVLLLSEASEAKRADLSIF
jgi:hypothetical protein